MTLPSVDEMIFDLRAAGNAPVAPHVAALANAQPAFALGQPWARATLATPAPSSALAIYLIRPGNP